MAPLSERWRAVSARIRGLSAAGHRFAEFLSVRSSDSYGIGRGLLEQCASILELIRQFEAAYQSLLSPEAVAAIQLLLTRLEPMVHPKGGSLEEKVRTALVLLVAFESELSFLVEDRQALIRGRSERAFAHLQRSIVADAELRRKWEGVFQEGEVSCEKLGAVHLLLHGIWAFKVDASGGRTDLVYQDRLPVSASLDLADGLVLTEWKRAMQVRDAALRFEEARMQAKRYSTGVLAGVELTSYRFVVVVTQRQVEPPADVLDGGVIYRHVNIAVSPESPSRR